MLFSTIISGTRNVINLIKVQIYFLLVYNKCAFKNRLDNIYMYISIYMSLSLYPIILICFIQTVSHSEVFLSLQFEDHLRLSSLWVGSYILFPAKNMLSMQILGSVFQEVTLAVVSSKWLVGQQMALVTQTL